MSRITSTTALLLIFAGIAAAQETSNRFAFADFLLVPLRVHLLSAKGASNASTTLTEQDIARILPKMNRVWAQAGIHFYLESLLKEEAAGQEGYDERAKADESRALLSLRPKETLTTNQFHLYYIHQFRPNGIYIGPGGIFVKDTASLRKVPGGIDEPLPRVSSHELGHAFTLPHRQDVTNLMASGTTGTWLNEAEIQQARASAKKRDWIQPASEVLKRADELHTAKKATEARALYQRLATVPLPAKEVEHAKQRGGGEEKPAAGK